MSLKSKIVEDMKLSLKNKETEKLSVIRMILAAIKQVEVDERVELDDQRIIQILSKMIKQRQESERIYREANRSDLADKEFFEINMIKSYLPLALSESEILVIIKNSIKELGIHSIKDMGKVISHVKSQLIGRADMGQVSQLIKSLLQP